MSEQSNSPEEWTVVDYAWNGRSGMKFSSFEDAAECARTHSLSGEIDVDHERKIIGFRGPVYL